MESGCIRSYPRRATGYEVRKLFENTGVKVTDTLISIIDRLLTEYDADILERFGSPALIEEIYSKAKEQYDKSVSH
jgi:hypothetical protein